MNNVFSCLFVLSMIYTVWIDQKRLKKAKQTEKIIYYIFFAATAFFFISLEMELELPMPSKFVIYRVVPWLNAMIQFH